MNREKIVSQLIKEGFSEKTLVKFNDNQLNKLAKKILSEQVTTMPVKPVKPSYKIGDEGGKLPPSPKGYSVTIDPADKKPVVQALESEVEENEETIDVDNTEEMNEWVKKVIEKNYHAVATKGAILETIKVKIQEKATMIPMPAKAKRGHNGIPEFMTYDSIVSSAKPEEAPSQPEVIPDTPTRETPPKREDDPRRSPFRNPNEEPVPDVDPKARRKANKLNRLSKMSMAAE